MWRLNAAWYILMPPKSAAAAATCCSALRRMQKRCKRQQQRPLHAERLLLEQEDVTNDPGTLYRSEHIEDAYKAHLHSSGRKHCHFAQGVTYHDAHTNKHRSHMRVEKG
jgi:hypothetical protein